MAQSIIGIVKSQVTAATDNPEFRLGTVAGLTDFTKGYQEFVYGRANGAVTGLGYACVEETGFDFAMINVTKTTPGTAGYGSRMAVAQAVLADNQYGWFQIYGKGSLRILASCAKGTRLNTTGTSGAVDDDATGGSEAIAGVVLGTAAAGAAEETNADAMFTYPSVSVTL